MVVGLGFVGVLCVVVEVGGFRWLCWFFGFCVGVGNLSVVFVFLIRVCIFGVEVLFC